MPIQSRTNQHLARAAEFALVLKLSQLALNLLPGVARSASGACGIVRLDLFFPEKENGLTLWGYEVRKAITNPSAVLIPGTPPVQCSKMDQGTYIYSWRPRVIQQT